MIDLGKLPSPPVGPRKETSATAQSAQMTDAAVADAKRKKERLRPKASSSSSDAAPTECVEEIREARQSQAPPKEKPANLGEAGLSETVSGRDKGAHKPNPLQSQPLPIWQRCAAARHLVSLMPGRAVQFMRHSAKCRYPGGICHCEPTPAIKVYGPDGDVVRIVEIDEFGNPRSRQS
jgi:hypothetical protein